MQIARLITVLMFFLTALQLTVAGQTREELEKRRRQIQAEIEQLQKQQSAISKDRKAGIGQLNLIQSKLQKRYAVIENINDEVKLIDNNIFSNNREIYRLKRQLDTLREHYGLTIQYAYKNSSNYDMLNFIFTSAGFNDAVRRIAYLKSYRSYRDEQVASIQKTKAQLEGKIQQLSLNKTEKNKALDEQNKQKQILEEEKTEKAGFVNKLRSREKELSKEMAAKKNLDIKLQSAIAAIVKREIKLANELAAAKERERIAAAKAKGGNVEPAAASKPSTTVTRKSSVLESTPEVTRVSVGFENNRRSLPWPVDMATVNSGYGKRNIEGTRLIEDNIGITIGTQKGTAVKAVFEGVVAAVFDIAGSQTVAIKHGKYFTTYYNLSSINVSKGNEVKMGQVIGRAGVNDEGEGEILFAVSMGSDFMDPQLWLKSR
jgi:septal ring factor EnvC (AmiA/AmiB activator)